MARRIKDPQCKHKRAGIVTSHPEGFSPFNQSEGHAATSVCARDDCIEDAIEWASMISGRPAVFLPDATQATA